ncbi:sugar transferase [Mycolicibacterium phocaicum]|uniref:sugar transferase n=1 Tax=Mycolicibacterium phocaicum TaxID=319706 RepID=UPI001CFA51E0|nr:sugar transferase [Mycolicibacterium phocaicum]UCZ60887.1 sugar transferase [Mycolicibacterium phocaicum]
MTLSTFAFTRTPNPVVGITSPRTQQLNTRPVWQHVLARRVLMTDTAAVVLAVLFAQWARFGRESAYAPAASAYFTMYSVLLASLWLGALSLYHARSGPILGSGIEEYRRVVAASFWTFGAVAIVALLSRVDIARGYLAYAFPLGTCGLLLGRKLWRRRVRARRLAGDCQTRVLAIGDRQAVAVLADALMNDPGDGFVVVGAGVPGEPGSRGDLITVGDTVVPILGDEIDALDALGDTCAADTVALTDAEHFGCSGIQRLTWRLEERDVDLVVSPGLLDVAGARLAMTPVAGMPLLHVEPPQYRGAKRFQKKAFDFGFALAALIGTAPLLLLAAIAIKLTSRGPVFYRAERIGLDGKPFTMIKFRSMVVDAEARLSDYLASNDIDGGVMFKMREDPRVTPIGRVLRRYSIDELPQFINVLKQDMSVVGPRPPLRREVESYNGDIKRKLLVKPGVTGLWQISGRSNLSWEKSVRLDLSYVDNWSMTTDVGIILKTVGAVARAEGAY